MPRTALIFALPSGKGRTRDELKALITAAWEGRADRGAEERKALEALGLREQRLIEINRLREDPHLKCMRAGMTAGTCCSRCRIGHTVPSEQWMFDPHTPDHSEPWIRAGGFVTPWMRTIWPLFRPCWRNAPPYRPRRPSGFLGLGHTLMLLLCRDGADGAQPHDS